MTPYANAEAGVVSSEEKIEYRDQDGNLLDEEQVQALKAEGNAKFETKYETRTRVVDELGNEVPQQQLAPDHPDVQGQNPDTQGMPESEANRQPAPAQAGSSKKNEVQGEAKPASDASEATK